MSTRFTIDVCVLSVWWRWFSTSSMELTGSEITINKHTHSHTHPITACWFIQIASWLASTKCFRENYRTRYQHFNCCLFLLKFNLMAPLCWLYRFFCCCPFIVLHIRVLWFARIYTAKLLYEFTVLNCRLLLNVLSQLENHCMAKKLNTKRPIVSFIVSQPSYRFQKFTQQTKLKPSPIYRCFISLTGGKIRSQWQKT